MPVIVTMWYFVFQISHVTVTRARTTVFALNLRVPHMCVNVLEDMVVNFVKPRCNKTMLRYYQIKI